MAEVMKYDDFKEHGSETAVKVRTVRKYFKYASASKALGVICTSFLLIPGFPNTACHVLDM